MAMNKRIPILLLAGTIIFSVCGCGKYENIPIAATAEIEENQKTNISEMITAATEDVTARDLTPEDTTKDAAATETTSHAVADTFSFADFSCLQFTFYSGAGGWGTLMRVDSDGVFSGKYFDGEMGVTGEGYPNGTMYQCDFTGKFTVPVQIDDFTYSTRIQEINYEKEPGTEEIIDGTLYAYAKPYGLDGAEEILIYAPGIALSELPVEYRSWVGYYDLSMTEDTELPFWGLYNKAEECGFASYHVIDRTKEIVAIQEEVAVSLENSIKNDVLTQADYNEKSIELYVTWDYALNSVWNTLKDILDKESMNSLTIEERAWITEKEQAVKEAGAGVEGGSMQPMVQNLKAAELTKERVYELLDVLEQAAK